MRNYIKTSSSTRNGREKKTRLAQGHIYKGKGIKVNFSFFENFERGE